MNKNTYRFTLLIAGALALAAPGCTRVQPWERGTLARPVMQAEPDPVYATFTEHVHFTREAASGGQGIGGGGCGCN